MNAKQDDPRRFIYLSQSIRQPENRSTCKPNGERSLRQVARDQSINKKGEAMTPTSPLTATTSSPQPHHRHRPHELQRRSTIDEGEHENQHQHHRHHHTTTSEENDSEVLEIRSVGQHLTEEDDDEDDVDEFKDSSYDDMPVRDFLINESMRSLVMTHSSGSNDDDENHNIMNGNNLQQATSNDNNLDRQRLDNNLDEEMHQDLSDLNNMPMSDNELLEASTDAFEVPDDGEAPNSTFLRRQDSEYYGRNNTNCPYKNNNGSGGSLFYISKPLLDDEKHKIHTLTAEVDDGNDGDDDFENSDGDNSDIGYDEFETADGTDVPDTTYLRAQDSDHSREDFFAVLEKPIIDDEKHSSVTAEFRINNVSRADSCEDFPDFESGQLEDAPVTWYLRKQVSEEFLEHGPSNGGDHDKAKVIGGDGDVRRASRRKPSPNDQSKNQQTRSKMKTSSRTPTTKHYPTMTTTPTKSISPTRTSQATTPMNNLSSATKRLSSPTGRGSKLRSLTSAYLRDCLDSCRGEGNISTGGLGTSAYLRIMQSQICIEEDEEKKKAHLQAALNDPLSALKIAEQRRGKSPPTLLCNEFVGSKCLVASILNKMGFADAARRHSHDVLDHLLQSCSDLPQDDCSLIHGRGGMLLAIWYLRSELNDASLGRDLALAISSVVLLEGTKNANTDEARNKNGLLLMWKFRGRSFLGATTGISGVLYSLLGHTEEEWSVLEKEFPRVKEVVKSTIDGLERHKHESGNLRTSLDGYEQDKMTNWSHGSPGYCMLLLRAFEVYDDEKYLQQTKDIAEKVMWARRMQRKNIGILRGISGTAYVLLALAKADPTTRELWIARVEQIVISTIDDLQDLLSRSKRPNSLFEGLGGFISLLIDLQNPQQSHIPFIESASSGIPDKRPCDVNLVSRIQPAEEERVDKLKVGSRISDAAPIKTSTITPNSVNVANTPNESPRTCSRKEISDGTDEGPLVVEKASPPATSQCIPTPVAPELIAPSKHAAERSAHERQAQEKNSRIARQQMKICLANSTAGGNLMKGGLGPCVFLRLKCSETLETRQRGYRIKTLKMALRDAEAALSLAEKQIGAFHVSVFTGDFVGAKCLLAAILHKLNNREEAYRHVSSLLENLDEACTYLPPTDCDVMYGRAGALQAIWFLRRELGDATLGRDFVLKTSQAILMEGIANGRDHPEAGLLLLWKWRGSPFLGAAHGSVGVLHSLLGHTCDEWKCLEEVFPRVREVVHESIQSLGNFRHPSGNLKVTIKGRDEDNHTEWSHGSAGYCLLLVRAYEVFNDVRFLNLASDLAENVLWNRHMNGQGLGLARGISGKGYVFLALSRIDREHSTTWKARAEHIANAAIGNINSLLPKSNRPYSLYEGLGGLVSFLMDIQSSEPCFPFFESRSENLKAVVLSENKPQSSDLGRSKCFPVNAEVQSPQEKNEEDKKARSQAKLLPESQEMTTKDIVQFTGITSTRAAKTKASEAVKSVKGTTTSEVRANQASEVDVNKQESYARTPDRRLKNGTVAELEAAIESDTTIQQARSFSTPEHQKLGPQEGKAEKLVITPMAMREALFYSSQSRQEPSPARSVSHLPYTDDVGWTRYLPLAHQLLGACLQRNTAGGNLYSGGIGPWIFIQSKMARQLMTSSGGCQVQMMRSLKSAEDAARQAVANAETFKGPFYPSILTGDWVGAKCLLASVLCSSGNVPAGRKHGEEVIARLAYWCETNSEMECDVMHGMSGVLQAVWFLRQELGDPAFGRNFALSISLSILMKGLQFASSRQKSGWLLLWSWKGHVLLGAANGVAGILHSILGHSQEELDLLESHLPRFRDAIKQTIDNLHKHRYPSGNLRATLSSKEEDRHYGWAHGCAGYTLLLMRAAEVLNEPRYLELSKEMAMSVLWPRRGERMGVGLAQGLSGVAYVFLGLARLDTAHRDDWLGRAQYYVDAAVCNWGDLLPLTNRPYSLYEGLGGLVNLILDIDNTEKGHFPFFETEPGLRQKADQSQHENRRVKFSNATQTPAKKVVSTKTLRSGDDAVTASTIVSTRFASPNDEERNAESVATSPLTDPNVTPAKSRVSVADKGTASSRGKVRGNTIFKRRRPDRPSEVRRIVGGFQGSH